VGAGMPVGARWLEQVMGMHDEEGDDGTNIEGVGVASAGRIARSLV
jgi:hypothetical protein